LGERSVRNAEVTGSIPVGSTIFVYRKNKMKRTVRDIEESLEWIEARIEKARAYIAKGVNVDNSGCCSRNPEAGHPDWVESRILRPLERRRSRIRKRIEEAAAKEKDRRITERRKKQISDEIE
jgi:hypothetical protein